MTLGLEGTYKSRGTISVSRLIVLLTVGLLFFSCSVQRRVYNKGYYVGYKKNPSKSDYPLVASAKSSPSDYLAGKTAKKPVIHLLACDTLIFLDGKKLPVRITDLGLSKISYKSCDEKDKEVYKVKRNSLSVIVFRNGTKECIMPCAESQAQGKPEKIDEYNVYPKDSCVVIIRKNGKRIKARIIAYDKQEIEYKPLEGNYGNTKVIPQAVIDKIMPCGDERDIKVQLDKKAPQQTKDIKWGLVLLIISLVALAILGIYILLLLSLW